MKLLTPVVFASLLISASAWSQPGGNGSGRSGGCADDMMSLCAGARAGGRDAVRACMRSHKDQLSDACRQSLRQRMSDQSGGDDQGSGGKQGSGGPSDCRDDMKKLCSSVMGQGSDAMKACMREHSQDLSPACRDQLAKKRESMLDDSAKQGPAGDADGFKSAVKGIMQSCSNEQGLFCNGVKPKDGALMRCLMQHQDDASADCQDALEHAKPFAARRGAKGGAAPKDSPPADSQTEESSSDNDQ